jgi:hypothetical protein
VGMWHANGQVSCGRAMGGQDQPASEARWRARVLPMPAWSAGKGRGHIGQRECQRCSTVGGAEAAAAEVWAGGTICSLSLRFNLRSKSGNVRS